MTCRPGEGAAAGLLALLLLGAGCGRGGGDRWERVQDDIAELRAEVAALRQAATARGGSGARLAREVAALKARVAGLQREVAALATRARRGGPAATGGRAPSRAAPRAVRIRPLAPLAR